jgi:hypothetical protein
MKKRTLNYLRKRKAFRNMLQFKDITSFLMAGFILSKNIVVKKDMLQMLSQLQKQELQLIPIRS